MADQDDAFPIGDQGGAAIPPQGSIKPAAEFAQIDRGHQHAGEVARPVL